MRVITGVAKGHTLKGPKSDATRPTSDKIRGAIFAMLEARQSLAGVRVLDLYAGTGALGIEALSRGAAWCDFVEEDRTTCRIIAQNLEHTKLTGQSKVHCHTVEKVLAHPEILGHVVATLVAQHPHSLEGPEYDIILLDPPYADPMVLTVLDRLAASPLVGEGSLVILEHSKRIALAETYGNLRLLKTRKHGDTCISVFHVPGFTFPVQREP